MSKYWVSFKYYHSFLYITLQNNIFITSSETYPNSYFLYVITTAKRTISLVNSHAGLHNPAWKFGKLLMLSPRVF